MAKKPGQPGDAASWIALVSKLYRTLVSAGLDPERALKVAIDLVSGVVGKLKDITKQRTSPVRMEYTTVALSAHPEGSGKGTLLPRWLDGQEIPDWRSLELSSYLGDLDAAGWDLVSTVGQDGGGTLILRRLALDEQSA